MKISYFICRNKPLDSMSSLDMKYERSCLAVGIRNARKFMRSHHYEKGEVVEEAVHGNTVTVVIGSSGPPTEIVRSVAWFKSIGEWLRD